MELVFWRDGSVCVSYSLASSSAFWLLPTLAIAAPSRCGAAICVAGLFHGCTPSLPTEPPLCVLRFLPL